MELEYITFAEHFYSLEDGEVDYDTALAKACEKFGITVADGEDFLMLTSLLGE